ncbi:MAG: hypothetical protein IV090_01150 [Candidatus Sericytochromatia bacterium]|nr:hypothetical protein [Candidatus Sericytochromatia bacterium]
MSLLQVTDLLESEILAYLFSETAFKATLVQGANYEELCKEIWPSLEKILVKAAHGASLEHLHSLRDNIWFLNRPTGSVSLYEILHKYGQELLVNQGGIATPRLSPQNPKDTTNYFSRWRWFVYALPPDLLLAASWGINGPLELQTQTPLLKTHLQDHGYAQMHVHLGAELDFSVYWCSALSLLGSATFQPHSLISKGAEMNEGKNLAPWLLAGSIARLWLYAFLQQKEYSNFSQYFFNNIRVRLIETRPHLLATLEAVIQSLLSPQDLPLANFYLMKELYQDPGFPIQLPSDLEQVWQLDPISQFSPETMPASYKEVYWHRQAFAYLYPSLQEQHPRSQSHNPDPLFERLFWQCIRTKVLLYRHITQRPMVKGLQWFIRHYERIGSLSENVKGLRLSKAFELDGGRKGLRSLEVRVAPDNEPADIRNKVLDLAQKWQNIQNKGNTEIGLVFHVSKNRGKNKSHHWLDSHANPDSKINPTGYRYAKFFNKKTREVVAYRQFLEQVPLSIFFIRGSDMCTDEISIPNWIMCILIQSMHEAGLEASRCLKTLYSQWSFSAPHKTMHVGEDFHHLLDGIRRLAEVLDFVPLEQGDRIGHGLALGISPSWWGQQHPVVWMPKEIRLWDLIWEWQQYQMLLATGNTERRIWIEEQILELVQTIFGIEITLREVINLYQDLYNRQFLWAVGFPDGNFLNNQEYNFHRKNEQIQKRLEFLNFYLTNTNCFFQGQEIIAVHQTESEIEALYAMQRCVRNRVLAKDVSIEVNPSSNFLIADLQNLDKHPLWNLNPPSQSTEDMGPPVNICIGSDDPITFATNLPQEYELLYDVLHQKKLGREEARHWLDRVRQAGLDARFTLDLTQYTSNPSDIWDTFLHQLNGTLE